MKTLFIVHPSFTNMPQGLTWLMELTDELRKLQHDIEIFDPQTHKFSEFQIFHLFGFGFFELLWNLKNPKTYYLNTPSFDILPKRNRRLFYLEQTLTFLRTLTQKKRIPKTTFQFARGADHYFLLDAQNAKWAESWNLPSSKITILNKDVISTAKTLARFYRDLK